MEQNEKLIEIITRHKDMEGSLIPVLHEVQEFFGYIPKSAQELIASELEIPLSEIYGVITFYSRFTMTPKGKYNVFSCQGTACYVKGSEAVLQAVKDNLGIEAGETTEDGLFSIEEARCVGACGLAPIMMINDDVYAKLTPDMVEGILAKYRDKEESA